MTCLDAYEQTPKGASEPQYAVLTAANALNDALTVAKRLLTRRAGGEKYVFAMLAVIPNSGERQQALNELAPICKEGPLL